MGIELVIATTNSGKFSQIRDVLVPLTGLSIKSLNDFSKADGVQVLEDGRDEAENARKKVVAYGEVLEMNVLGIDNGLYLNGLDDVLQSRQEVRRFWGDKISRRLTDEELLAHFSGVIRGLGGEVGGFWRFAVCIQNIEGKLFETVIDEARSFVWKPSEKITSGYPLESLQKDPRTGRYIPDLSREEKAKFWQDSIGERLCSFVGESLDLEM